MLRAMPFWARMVMTSGFVALGIGALPAPNSTGWAGMQAGQESASNRLTDVEGFPLDYDSGSMAVHALRSCLQTYDLNYTYMRLMGVSGAMYKFVYDSTEAYEPLRDLYPFDVLKTACVQMGFLDAHWETGRSIEGVKEIVKREIDAGHPLITPFLKTDAYHGFFIITGYDYDQGIFYLQGAFEDTLEVAVPIPDGWDGPTVSPAGWASNPVFMIGGRSGKGTAHVQQYRHVVLLGVGMMKGGRLPYGNHPGEQIYMGETGPREAYYGLEAYGPLTKDVETQPLTVEVTGEKQVNFGLIWRIDAQIGQLEHDRRYGAKFVRYLAQGLPQKQKRDLAELRRSFRLTAQDAKDLRLVFWCEVPDTVVSPDMIADYARESPAIVLRLPEDDDLADELRREGHDVYSTVWGWILIDDTDAKRFAAKLLVRRIQSREKTSLGMLEEIAEYLDL